MTLKQRKESFVLRRMEVHRLLNVQKKIHYQFGQILSVCLFFFFKRKAKDHEIHSLFWKELGHCVYILLLSQKPAHKCPTKSVAPSPVPELSRKKHVLKSPVV